MKRAREVMKIWVIRTEGPSERATAILVAGQKHDDVLGLDDALRHRMLVDLARGLLHKRVSVYVLCSVD